MERKETSITELLAKRKELSAEDVENLWYDWFCKDSSLHNKGVSLLSRLNAISKTKKFNSDTSYVFFKNNCPMCGRLYDDFRICDIKTGDVIYTVIPASGHNSEYGVSKVWGRENNFKEPLVEGTWSDVKDFFLKECSNKQVKKA